MQHTITEADILDFLDKLKLFVPNLGEYEYHSSENFQYLIKTTNHSVIAPIETLVSNQQKKLTQQEFKQIAEKIGIKTVEQVKPQKAPAVAKKVDAGYLVLKSIMIVCLCVIGLIAAFGIVETATQDYQNSEYKLDVLKSGFDATVNEIEDEIEPEPKTEEELKEDLYNVECENPTKYIDGSLKMSPIYKNLLSLKVVGIKLKGSLVNNATMATFKNVKIKATFKSATGSELFSRVYEVYDFVGPQGSIDYLQEIEVTNQEYKDIEDFSWTVVSAGY